MPQGRQKSPGSFQDELGEVIERIASEDRKPPTMAERTKTPAKSNAVLDDRLFWRRPDERA